MVQLRPITNRSLGVAHYLRVFATIIVPCQGGYIFNLGIVARPCVFPRNRAVFHRILIFILPRKYLMPLPVGVGIADVTPVTFYRVPEQRYLFFQQKRGTVLGKSRSFSFRDIFERSPVPGHKFCVFMVSEITSAHPGSRETGVILFSLLSPTTQLQRSLTESG